MKNRLYITLIVIILGSTAYYSTASRNSETTALERCELISHAALTEADSDISQTIALDLEAYQSLVERALIYRANTIDAYNRIGLKLDNGQPLSGADIDELNQGSAAHLALRDQLYTAAYSYECWMDIKAENLNQNQQETKLQGIMLSLSSALVLYDNYLLAISVFEENTKLRRYLNAKHQEFNISRDKLAEITLQYNSVKNRSRVRKAINYFEDEWQVQSKTFKEENGYLFQLISQSQSYNSTLKFSPLFVLNNYNKFLSGFTRDIIKKTTDNGINLFSLAFGNSVGLIQSRNGYLHENSQVSQSIKPQLQAGDILLEKTPFRLTDKLIPGYWGHVAIWLGAEQELRDLGIWDHPVVKNFHPDIKAGLGVVEALRNGVQINSLEHFLNVDDVAVLRQRELSREDRIDIIILALRQVGKAYDFNFNIETNDKIVCSELVYVAYAKMEWPTEKTLGRHTISPTHIAEKANKDGPLQVMSLYLKGKEVKEKQQQFAMLL